MKPRESSSTRKLAWSGVGSPPPLPSGRTAIVAGVDAPCPASLFSWRSLCLSSFHHISLARPLVEQRSPRPDAALPFRSTLFFLCSSYVTDGLISIPRRRPRVDDDAFATGVGIRRRLPPPFSPNPLPSEYARRVLPMPLWIYFACGLPRNRRFLSSS